MQGKYVTNSACRFKIPSIQLMMWVATPFGPRDTRPMIVYPLFGKR
jgi:hypothetical protein